MAIFQPPFSDVEKRGLLFLLRLRFVQETFDGLHKPLRTFFLRDVPTVWNHDQLRVWQSVRQLNALLRRYDSIIVAGDDERWYANIF